MKKILSALLGLLLALTLCSAACAETLVYRGAISWEMTNLFQSANPDIALENQWGNNTEAFISQALTNRDASFDVLVINANYAYARMLEKGLAGDLSASEALTADMLTLDPAILSLLTDAEGRLRAYPAQISLSQWRVNEGFWRLVFGDQPIPSTMEELLTAWLTYETDHADDYPDLDFFENFTYEFLCERLIREYAMQYEVPGEALDLNTPALRQALELLAQIRDVRRRAGKPTMSADYENGWAEVATIVNFGNGEQVMAQHLGLDSGLAPELYGVPVFGHTAMPLAFAEGDPVKINASMSVYVINPYSEHQEAALRLIECAALADSNPYVTYAIHPQWTEPVANPTYALFMGIYQEEKASLEARLADADPSDAADLRDELALCQYHIDQIETTRWAISTEKLEAYRAISGQLDFHMDSVWVGTGTNAQSVITETCARYAAGTMSLDMFLRELSDRMGMIIQENQ